MSEQRTQHFEFGGFCAERQDEIVTYVFKEMGPGASEAFEAHLISCASCRDEVASLTDTLHTIAEATTAAPASLNGDGATWEEEWTLLRRRLFANEAFEAATAGVSGGAMSGILARRAAPRAWLARAAAAILTAGLAFSAGYYWRGTDAPSARPEAELRALPPIAGAAVGNYFDNLDDFTRDTHNFIRRSRMLLMEFTNLGEDTDPSFFRASCKDLLEEAARYQEIAERMQNRKLTDLLDQISGVFTVISKVDLQNQKQAISDVKATLDLTGLIATLELLDAAMERELKGQSNA